MKMITSIQVFDSLLSRDLVECVCYTCNKSFFKEKRAILKVLRKVSGHTGKYCSKICEKRDKLQPRITKTCLECNCLFSSLSRLRRKFCSSSCAGSFNNKHKTKGSKRSKLEVWIEKNLNKLYPNLEIHYNKKDTIGSELDIYIPSLKLGFELNGIFHYEPIYGQDKLNQIQNNDQNKFQQCQKLGISLCVIDTSSQKYFKESTSKKYLNIVLSILSQNISVSNRST